MKLWNEKDNLSAMRPKIPIYQKFDQTSLSSSSSQIQYSSVILNK